jgi:hypothetical protein
MMCMNHGDLLTRSQDAEASSLGSAHHWRGVAQAASSSSACLKKPRALVLPGESIRSTGMKHVKGIEYYDGVGWWLMTGSGWMDGAQRTHHTASQKITMKRKCSGQGGEEYRQSLVALALRFPAPPAVVTAGVQPGKWQLCTLCQNDAGDRCRPIGN